jgi:hypothetical protein
MIRRTEMTPMSKTDESRVIKAIEDAIVLTKEGSSPNEAIEKIATQNQLGPEMIRRVAEAYNKSKSVHWMSKAASPDDRAKSFPLADPSAIIHSIYVPKMDKAASAEPLQLPDKDFSRADVVMPMLDKQASARRTATITPSSALQRFEKYAGMCNLLEQNMHQKVAENRREFQRSLEKAAEEILPMAPGTFRKVAQMVVNGYPDNGQMLMTILARKTRKDLPELQKTAHAVVFPRKEPYVTICRVFEYAQKIAQSQTDYTLFCKEAKLGNVSLKAFLGHSAGAGVSRHLNKEDEGGFDPSGDALDPIFSNRLRELEAKRVLMGLILYDPDFEQYRYGDLVKSYNNAVQSVPEAFNNPVVLKNLMVKNLESSGVKDVFELKQESELSQSLGDRMSSGRQSALEEEELAKGPDDTRVQALQELVKAIPIPSPGMGKKKGKGTQLKIKGGKGKSKPGAPKVSAQQAQQNAAISNAANMLGVSPTSTP